MSQETSDLEICMEIFFSQKMRNHYKADEYKC